DIETGNQYRKHEQRRSKPAGKRERERLHEVLHQETSAIHPVRQDRNSAHSSPPYDLLRGHDPQIRDEPLGSCGRKGPQAPSKTGRLIVRNRALPADREMRSDTPPLRLRQPVVEVTGYRFPQEFTAHKLKAQPVAASHWSAGWGSSRPSNWRRIA